MELAVFNSAWSAELALKDIPRVVFRRRGLVDKFGGAGG